MGSVYITDYISNPQIEKGILGDRLSSEANEYVEVLLVWHQLIDDAFLEQFPRLKGVVRYGVGYDAIDLGAIERRGLVLCNTPDYGTDEVSDTALGMLLTITRGIHQYDFNARTYQQGWQENTLPHLKRSSETQVGVMGAGRIGTAFARKASAVGFKVKFFDPFQSPGYEKAIGIPRVNDVEELLNQSDVVSLHIPANSETSKMVDKSFLNKMKYGSSLINTARGELINDLDEVLQKLSDGSLQSIAFDVMPDEPPLKTSLYKEWKERTEMSARIIINPHTAYYTAESFIEMRTKASKNALRILNGVQPENILIDGRS